MFSYCRRVRRTSCRASTWPSRQQSLPRHPSRSTSRSSGSLALPSMLQGQPPAAPAPQRQEQPLTVPHHTPLRAGLSSKWRGMTAVMQQPLRVSRERGHPAVAAQHHSRRSSRGVALGAAPAVASDPQLMRCLSVLPPVKNRPSGTAAAVRLLLSRTLQPEAPSGISERRSLQPMVWRHRQEQTASQQHSPCSRRHLRHTCNRRPRTDTQ
jgi:hypothetical protein